MAIKRICDRCGADINPENSATYVRLWSAYEKETSAAAGGTELCVSCARQIREWLKPLKFKDPTRKEADHA